MLNILSLPHDLNCPLPNAAKTSPWILQQIQYLLAFSAYMSIYLATRDLISINRFSSVLVFGWLGVGMAPREQLADVWSCGVTLYVMLVGAYPFEDPGDPRNFRRTINVRTPDLYPSFFH